MFNPRKSTEIIITSNQSYGSSREIHDWVESRYVELLKDHIYNILKDRAKEEGMCQMDFSEMLLNIEALDRR